MIAVVVADNHVFNLRKINSEHLGVLQHRVGSFARVVEDRPAISFNERGKPPFTYGLPCADPINSEVDKIVTLSSFTSAGAAAATCAHIKVERMRSIRLNMAASEVLIRNMRQGDRAAKRLFQWPVWVESGRSWYPNCGE